MTLLRYVMCAALVLGMLGHLYGTFAFYTPGTDTFVWSLSGGALVACVIAMNIFAVSGSRAQVAAAGLAALAWAGLALAFGSAIGNPADPRVIAHVVPSLVLAGLDAWLLVRRPAQTPAPARH